MAAQLQIEPLLERRPAQLSGGQRQRVALGRAMVRHPDVFLMDEPLSNLDAKLRVHMRSELAELHARLGTTFIYVTHDQVEAMTMSDRVAMMDAGVILQLGTPSDLYARPANVKVAQFIGSPAINLLPARASASGRRRAVRPRAADRARRSRRRSADASACGPKALTPAPAGSVATGHARARRARCAAARTSAPSTSCTSMSPRPRAARVICRVAGGPETLADRRRRARAAVRAGVVPRLRRRRAAHRRRRRRAGDARRHRRFVRGR